MLKTLEQLFDKLSDHSPDVCFEVRFWDGKKKSYGTGERQFLLTFATKRAAEHVIESGSLGFGEEYMSGHIQVEGDFRQLLRFGTDAAFLNLPLGLKTKLAFQHLRQTSLNTLSRAPKHIAHHYDLGNDFYKLWLDDSMAYSCAYFRHEHDTLEEAQQQKYEHICRKLQLKTGETLVDIGCGWGGMLRYAAKHYGVRGVGCSLSKQQVEYATDLVTREGLSDKVSVVFEDYRKLEGQFDKFVSIGMFEHVGKQFIPTFMEKARSLLKRDGIGLLHTIGEERSMPGDPWTLKYIFPGGYIPSLDEIVRTMGETGLVPTDIENLRLHYAKTVEEWCTRFEAQTKKIETMFDASFVRMWRMFLNGCVVNFRYGNPRLYQVLFTNGLNNTLPLTRDYMYR
ncbi:MAG TPA: cyclopropane-fatty-acyl-phospholipid synthase family protein [Nitrospiraceae bacterium]|nr:cyclopropane-fatty-acyl-phospholipid synthase family protein [Nitrospiraceae bacterium]